MSTLCVIQGCPGSTRGKRRGEKIYYFRALEDQLEEWNRVIPGDSKLKLHDKVCSRHFKDDDLMKEWNFVIDEKTVTMPRGRWTLKVGAVPAIFDNYNDDLRVRIERKSKPKSLVDFGGSSSDEDYEELCRKPIKKLKGTRSPRMVKNLVKRAPKISNTDLKSRTRSEKTSREPSGESANQADDDISWEKECDSFVDQLSFICAPTPTRNTDAEPAKRGRGRPRKKELRTSLVSQIPSSQEHSTKLERKKFSSNGPISDLETENSVIIEEFVASGYDETIDVEILDDPDSSPQITATWQIPSNVIIKEEKCDEEYENYNSATNRRVNSFCVTSSSEDSTVRQQQTIQESERNYEGVVVKREICECEGRDSQCCEPHPNHEHTVLELPASPLPCEGTSLPHEEHQINHRENLRCPQPEIGRNGRTCKIAAPEINIIPVSVPPVVHEVPKPQQVTSQVNSELKPTTLVECAERGTLVSAPYNSCAKRVISESQVELTGQTTRCIEHSTRTPTPRSGCKELALQVKAPEMELEKLPRTSKKWLHVDEHSDVEMDFFGFSSDGEEEQSSKRKYFQNTAEMAAKSTALYFSKLTKSTRKRRSSVEIALDQLNDMESVWPACSKKPTRRVQKVVEIHSAPTIQEPSVHEGRFINKNHLVEERLAPGSKCDEVLKCGRISDEVTVTKAPNHSQRLDKVAVSHLSQGLDKLTSSSNHVLLADESNLKMYSPRGNLISNKVGTSSNYLLKDKVTPSSTQDHLLKDKVTISSKHEFLKDKGTSTAEYEPMKDKIPTAYSGPATDKLSQLLNGSSLDRILQATRSSSLLDSVTSHAACDPSVDKTSMILKNFKSDGVLALECVVLKEQVRQLQKELFLHKQMLIDSEHNASLLRRKLELQTQLPCANCVNFKRGFIGKETLI